MFTLPLLSLLLATSALASPVRRHWNDNFVRDAPVTIWNLGDKLPPSFDPITNLDTLADTALVVATMAYTCDATGEFNEGSTADQAYLYRFDIETNIELISTLPITAYIEFDSVYWDATQFTQENNLTSFGQIEGLGKSGITNPIWTDFTSFDTNITVSGELVTSVPSVYGINWAEYNVESQKVNRAYMINTVGGLSPNTFCIPGTVVNVPFTAITLFYQVQVNETNGN